MTFFARVGPPGIYCLFRRHNTNVGVCAKDGSVARLREATNLPGPAGLLSAGRVSTPKKSAPRNRRATPYLQGKRRECYSMVCTW